MGRSVAVTWHAAFSTVAAALYFFFVLPRWYELTGVTPYALGAVLRIAAGGLVALTALPVIFTLLRIRGPELDTPRLALRLLAGSVVAHVLAGIVIAGTAVSEVWLPLDRFGPWSFGIYGAAAAIALLGIGTFYLAFYTELPLAPPKPPKPPKPGKPKKPNRPRLRRGPRPEHPEHIESEGAAEAGAEATEAAGEVETTEATDELESAETMAQGSGSPGPQRVSTGGRHKLPGGHRHRLPAQRRRELRPQGKLRAKKGR